MTSFVPNRPFTRRQATRAIAAPFALGALGVLGACAEVREKPDQYAATLVARAADTVERMKLDPNLKTLMTHLGPAPAVVVLPHVYKAGFIAGAEGGSGVLLARQAGGGWSAPAFYTLAAGSLGFQIGIQDTEVILILRNPKALDAILRHQAKFGADGGITVGVFGAGVEGSTTTSAGPDVLAIARSRLGLYGGLTLEGAGLVRRNDLMEAVHGPGVTPQAVVQGGGNRYAPADRLRQMLGG
jgi:lipid-binding SYLF domain-containing protein